MIIGKLKYVLFGITALVAVSCTEEDNNPSYPEYTHFDNPQWTPVASPELATAPADWTIQFTGGIKNPQWTPVSAIPSERPTWSKPDAFVYPASMTATIQVSPYIEPMMTDNDLLGAFIGSECRGLGTLRNGVWLLQIKAESSENRNVELRYYCAQNQELFVCSNAFMFRTDSQQGSLDTPFAPQWESQSDLPLYTDYDITVDLKDFDNASVGSGDLLAAFVGNECRGVASPSMEGTAPIFHLRAFARQANETFTLHYYNDALKDEYIYGDAVAVQHATLQTLTLPLQEHGYMDLSVSLPEVLTPYLSEKDNLTAIVSDHPCSIIQTSKPKEGRYELKMKASNGDQVSFRYYCDSLKYIFTSENCLSYADAQSWGTTEEPQVLPLKTAQKVVCMSAVFTVTEYKAFNTTLAENDLLAAFVDDECRGVAAGVMQGDSLIFPMQIRGTLGKAEQITLQYYHCENSYLFTCPKKFDFVAGGKIGTADEPMGIILNVVNNPKSE